MCGADGVNGAAPMIKAESASALPQLREKRPLPTAPGAVGALCKRPCAPVAADNNETAADASLGSAATDNEAWLQFERGGFFPMLDNDDPSSVHTAELQQRAAQYALQDALDVSQLGAIDAFQHQQLLQAHFQHQSRLEFPEPANAAWHAQPWQQAYQRQRSDPATAAAAAAAPPPPGLVAASSADPVRTASGASADSARSSASNDGGASARLDGVAYAIFGRYVTVNSVSGQVDASRVFSVDCFREWHRSRKNALKNPFESFRRALLAHVTGLDGRKPFEEHVEAAILVLVRRNEVWACFREQRFQNGKPVQVGLYGFRGAGFWESRRRSAGMAAGAMT